MTCYSVHLPVTFYSVHASGWLHQVGRRLPQPPDLPCRGGGLETQVDLHPPASQRTTAYCQIAKNNTNCENHKYTLSLNCTQCKYTSSIVKRTKSKHSMKVSRRFNESLENRYMFGLVALFRIAVCVRTVVWRL